MAIQTWQAYTMMLMYEATIKERHHRMLRLIRAWEKLFGGLAVPDDHHLTHNEDATYIEVDGVIVLACRDGNPNVYIGLKGGNFRWHISPNTTWKGAERIVVEVGRAIKRKGDKERKARKSTYTPGVTITVLEPIEPAPANKSFADQLADAIFGTANEGIDTKYESLLDDPR